MTPAPDCCEPSLRSSRRTVDLIEEEPLDLRLFSRRGQGVSKLCNPVRDHRQLAPALDSPTTANSSPPRVCGWSMSSGDLTTRRDTPPAPAKAPGADGEKVLARNVGGGLLPPADFGTPPSTRPYYASFRRKTGVVVILDILGTRGVTSRMDPEHAMELRRQLFASARASVEGPRLGGGGIFGYIVSLVAVLQKLLQTPGDPGKENRRIIVFSDSLILTAWSDDEPEFVLVWMGYVVCQILTTAIKLGVLMRGAAAFGDFFEDEFGIVGPAVDDAAEWENLADWGGLILTPATGYRYEACREKLSANFNWRGDPYLSYEVPLIRKLSEVTLPVCRLWAANWTEKTDSFRSEVVEAFSKNPILPVAETKYRNTLEFLRVAGPAQTMEWPNWVKSLPNQQTLEGPFPEESKEPAEGSSSPESRTKTDKASPNPATMSEGGR